MDIDPSLVAFDEHIPQLVGVDFGKHHAVLVLEPVELLKEEVPVCQGSIPFGPDSCRVDRRASRANVVSAVSMSTTPARQIELTCPVLG